jgi:hypothetical protein
MSATGQTLFGDWQVAPVIEITPEEIEAIMRVRVAEQWKALSLRVAGRRYVALPHQAHRKHRARIHPSASSADR